MIHRYISNNTVLLSLVIPLALVVSLSGCLLLGLGAAAGAAVGGCAILDRNDDDRVTEAEFAASLFNDWDTNDNNVLTEGEFDAGVDESSAYADIEGNFDEWDDNNNGSLTQAEFRSGIAADANYEDWLDDECDDLGL